jgi:hypothetical protein
MMPAPPMMGASLAQFAKNSRLEIMMSFMSNEFEESLSCVPPVWTRISCCPFAMFGASAHRNDKKRELQHGLRSEKSCDGILFSGKIMSIPLSYKTL